MIFKKGRLKTSINSLLRRCSIEVSDHLCGLMLGVFRRSAMLLLVLGAFEFEYESKSDRCNAEIRSISKSNACKYFLG